MNQSIAWMRHVSAVFFSLIGCGGVLVLVLLMNVRPEKKVKKIKSTKMEFVYQPPPRRKPRKRKVKRRRRQIRRQMKAPRAPMPRIASSLSGVDFGLPSFGSTGIDDASDQLLGQTKNLNKLVMTANSVDKPPEAVYRAKPKYPPRAIAQSITGFVTMELLISAQGEVEEAQVANSNPPGIFDQSAISAIKQWRYTPAMYKGTPVKIRAKQTLKFNLGS